jgi:hypothetical protein
MDTSLCVICRRPNDIWIKFLNGFTKYTGICVVVDDNETDYVDMYKEYTRVKIIQIPDQVCLDAGFKNMVKVTIPKDVTAWEKALYYFSVVNTNYKYVWFLEDDVFVFSEDTLVNIDLKYIDDDFISSSREFGDQTMPWYWWGNFEIQLPQRVYHCMCCAVRMSKRLVDEVKLYASVNGTLTFLEALFPTLCRYKEFTHTMPYELDNCIPPSIDYEFFKIEDINSTEHLWHPIKKCENHQLIRSLLQNLG